MGRRVSSVGCVNFKNYNSSEHHLLALRLLWGGVGWGGGLSTTNHLLSVRPPTTCWCGVKPV